MNKYWIGYLTGIIICINIFSAGVILANTFKLNFFIYFWLWLISLLFLIGINYLINKYKKEKIIKGD